jgi:hypothetical protein
VVRVEVSALDLAVEAGLLAILLRLVMLLAFLEETMRCVVVRYALGGGGFERVRSGVWRDRLGAVARVELFENLAASL